MKTKEYTSWETIQKLYPDRFVLVENPVYIGTSPVIKEGIFLYKHKSYKKVVEKDLELDPSYSTIKYTGGIRGDRALEKTWVL